MLFEIEGYPSLRRAVDELCDFLATQEVPLEQVFDSKLAAYELLGNVLKHSGGKAQLHGGVREGFIELKILAEKAFAPPTSSECSDVYSEHGRGLFLVDSVCAERLISEDGGIVIKIKIER